MRAWFVVGAAGLAACYAPNAQIGATCDPADAHCPSGQRCVPAPDGFRCEVGEPAIDAPMPKGHVVTMPGWKSSVYVDYSDRFTYVAADFVDGPETYDNAPDGLFVLQKPFPDELAVIAGRDILELSATTYVDHDFSNHLPNTATQPDHPSRGLWIAADKNGKPAVLIGSSSANGGDGTYEISSSWSITRLRTDNNTRSVLRDEDGAFDGLGTAELYAGTQNGIVRDSTGVVVIAGDTICMQPVGKDLLIVRRSATGEQLIRIASSTHAELAFTAATSLRLADGVPPAPDLAYAVIDGAKLQLVHADGTLEPIAETTDPAYVWPNAATPPASHALAGPTPRIYVLESNRALDLDRVLVFEKL